LFADGPVTDRVVLVHVVLGGVGALAAQLAVWGGATVIGTVRRHDDLGQVKAGAGMPVVALDDPDPAAAIRAIAPQGVDRIVEISFSDNVDLDTAVARNEAVKTCRRGSRPGRRRYANGCCLLFPGSRLVVWNLSTEDPRLRHAPASAMVCRAARIVSQVPLRCQRRGKVSRGVRRRPDDIAAANLAAVQRPANTRADTDASAVEGFRSIPSYALVTLEDKAINPDVQCLMTTRAKARITEVNASHVVMLSRPDAVTKIIEQAARRLSRSDAYRTPRSEHEGRRRSEGGGPPPSRPATRWRRASLSFALKDLR
jgi:hypothetical protein